MSQCLLDILNNPFERREVHSVDHKSPLCTMNAMQSAPCFRANNKNKNKLEKGMNPFRQTEGQTGRQADAR